MISGGQSFVLPIVPNPTLQFFTSAGQLTSLDNLPCTITLGAGASPSLSLSGTKTANANAAGNVVFTDLSVSGPAQTSVPFLATCNWITGGTVTATWTATIDTMKLSVVTGLPASYPLSDENDLNAFRPAPAVALSGTNDLTPLSGLAAAGLSCSVAVQATNGTSASLLGTSSVPVSDSGSASFTAVGINAQPFVNVTLEANCAWLNGQAVTVTLGSVVVFYPVFNATYVTNALLVPSGGNGDSLGLVYVAVDPLLLKVMVAGFYHSATELVTPVSGTFTAGSNTIFTFTSASLNSTTFSIKEADFNNLIDGNGVITVASPVGPTVSGPVLFPGLQGYADLSSFQVVPPQAPGSAPAHGSASVSIAGSAVTIQYALVGGPCVNSAALYAGAIGTVGTLIASLPSSSSTLTLSAATVSVITSGGAYVQINTCYSENVRGQILFDNLLAPPLYADLSGGSNVPPSSSQASGVAAVSVSLDGTYAAVYTSFKGLSNIISGALYSNGIRNAIGTSSVTLPPWPVYGFVVPISSLFPLSSLVSSQSYITYNTTTFPAGELRGQIIPTLAMYTLSANLYLNGAQTRPEVVNATTYGTALVMLDPVNLLVSVSKAPMVQTETAAHIHQGGPDSAGPPIIHLFVGTPYANSQYDVPPTFLPDLLEGLAYINIHTPTNPGGELRGQVIFWQQAGIAYLYGASQVPPVPSLFTGVGTIFPGNGATNTSINLYLDETFPAADNETKAHVHIGAPGSNGPVGITLPHNGSFSIEVIPNATVNSFIANGGTYFNVHTVLYGEGEIRGQIANTSLWATFESAFSFSAVDSNGNLGAVAHLIPSLDSTYANVFVNIAPNLNVQSVVLQQAFSNSHLFTLPYGGCAYFAVPLSSAILTQLQNEVVSISLVATNTNTGSSSSFEGGAVSPGNNPTPPFTITHNVTLTAGLTLGWSLSSQYLISQTTLQGNAWLAIGIQNSGNTTGPISWIIAQPGLNSVGQYLGNSTVGNLTAYNGSFLFGGLTQLASSGRLLGATNYTTVVKFIRALADPSFPVSTSGNTSISWAVGKGPALSSGVASSGSYIINFNTGGNSAVPKPPLPSGGWKTSDIAHGALAFLGVGFAQPLGVYAAAFIPKPADGTVKSGEDMMPLWLKAHVGLQTTAYVFAFISFFAAVGAESVKHFSTHHGGLGLFFFLLITAQFISGVLRPKANQPLSAVRKAWQYLHKGFGYFNIIFGFATMFTGFTALTPQPSMVSRGLYGAWVAIILVIWIALTIQRVRSAKSQPQVVYGSQPTSKEAVEMTVWAAPRKGTASAPVTGGEDVDVVNPLSVVSDKMG